MEECFVAIWQHNDLEQPIVFQSIEFAMRELFGNYYFYETPNKPWQYELFILEDAVNHDEPDWVVFKTSIRN